MRAAWRDVDGTGTMLAASFCPTSKMSGGAPGYESECMGVAGCGKTNKKEEELDADAVGELRRGQRYGINFR